MARSNEKVSNCIPHDLMFSIMSKLPPKSLNRFKCVRKSWALIFENSYFMNMYRKRFISNNSYYDDTFLLLKQSLGMDQHSLLYLFSGDGFTSKVKLDWPLPLQEDDRDINILGSEINGNLCLYADNDNSKVVVWNPSFKEFKVIPPNLDVFVLPHIVRVASQLHGFGYDYNGDDYKLIRYVRFYPYHNYLLTAQINVSRLMSLLNTIYDYPSWEIYSLKSSSWKKLDLDMPTYKASRRDVLEQVYTKGMCHWLCEGEYIDNSYLMSFDLDNEVFSLTPTSPLLMDTFEDIHLMLLNEFIALMYKDVEMTTFHISILGEIGVKESWMKLFIVESLPYLGHPIGVGKNGNIFFVIGDEEIAMCDLSTHTIQELGIKGSFTCQIVTYKKSLLSIAE